MIKVTIEKKVEINLAMSVEAAEWLKDFVQNSYTGECESSTQSHYRNSLFTGLRACLPKVPRRMVLARADELIK